MSDLKEKEERLSRDKFFKFKSNLQG